MGYYYTAEPENAPLANSLATSETHVPGPPVKERGYRYYQPETGRWASRDPIGEDGFSIIINGRWVKSIILRNMWRLHEKSYLFCGNSPIVSIDLLGLATMEDIAKIIGDLFTTGSGGQVPDGVAGAMGKIADYLSKNPDKIALLGKELAEKLMKEASLKPGPLKVKELGMDILKAGYALGCAQAANALKKCYMAACDDPSIDCAKVNDAKTAVCKAKDDVANALGDDDASALMELWKWMDSKAIGGSLF